MIPHLERLVKGFRKLFFSPYCGNATFQRHHVCYSCTADEKHRLAQTARPLRVLSVSDLLRNKWLTSSTHRSARPSAFLGYRPLTVFIIAHSVRFVKRFFRIFSSASTITTVGELSAEPPGRLHSPPDIIIIPHPPPDYKMVKYTKYGILDATSLCALSIDKIAGSMV